ncbi:MAG: asparagine synthase (glutamine-hydrolyzing), partial [Cytophagales bacterium]
KRIAKILTSYGYRFSTQSDSEVLIKAFDCWREKAVDYFIGMFAFAIYDQQSHNVWLFRDRLGVKPLYYSLLGGLSFASELKAFKAHGIERTIDPLSLHQYFRFGYNLGERTIFKEVKKILPGQYLKYSAGTASLHSYWQPTVLPATSPPTETAEALEELLISAFNYRMVADVPVGVFLSGGIDSLLVATLLQQHSGQRIKTFTIGFDHADFDESTFAKKVADRIGTEHIAMKLEIADVQRLFSDFYEIFDEPFADTSGIPTALVAQLAKRNGVKVVLSADGADELFGGYTHYQSITKMVRHLSAFPLSIRKIVAKTFGLLPHGLVKQVIPFNFEHRVLALQELLSSSNNMVAYESRIANQTHAEIEQLIGKNNLVYKSWRLPSTDSFQEDMMRWDLTNFLTDDLLLKVDRATMFNGIEGREPFLDHRLVEYALQLPLSAKINGNSSKYILRQILNKYHPPSLFDRPKRGFSIPIFSWFSQKLDQQFNEYLTEANLKNVGILEPKVVKYEMKKYSYYKRQGNQYNIEKMWRILSFMMWHQRWMK